MTRLNNKIARLEAFKKIVTLVENEIASTKDYAEQCMKNHTDDPDHPYYAQWALDSQAEAKSLENAILEIIDLAVSK